MKTRAVAAESYAHPAPAAAGARGRPARADGRLQIDVDGEHSPYATLAADVRRGLLAPQKAMPPKYFYDARGAQLFDTICDLPEYYLTRMEHALLQQFADEIVAITNPSHLVEFGSGASRKTRLLLDAIQRGGGNVCYVPIDVSDDMLRRSARALLREYPGLRIHAVVGDYDHHLDRIPPGHQRLVAFLGSTIGNLTRAATARFLARVRRQLAPGEAFLLGVDLLKPIEVLERAYNDTAGVTAEFNRNVLRVINQRLDADFDLDRFEHLALFNQEQSQIEMHLRARTTHSVSIRALGLTVPFSAGETIHTEISRKFTRAEVDAMLTAAGYELTRWYAAPNDYFGLALARVI